MILDPLKVIQAITNNLAKPAMQQLQRNELVIRVLKDLNLDPTQPPDDVDGVYAIALVEYGVDKPESILNLLRQNEIKKAFWQAYTSKNPFEFLKKVEDFIKPVDDWNSLGDEIRESGLDIADEIEKFGQGFIDVAKRTKSAKFESYPDWNMDYYPGVRKSLFQEKVKRFCGRGFVFEAWQAFLNDKPNGYFIVLGDAGMGKSTIAAKYVISGSNDDTLKVWDLADGKLIANFTGESGGFFCCAVAPDGTIVAGDELGRVHFLRLEGMET